MAFLSDLEKHKEKVAFISPNGDKLSYNHVLIEAEKISSLIKKRSLVLIVAETNISALIGYISVIRSDSVVMFCDVKLNYPDMIEIIKNYEPDFIFSPKYWREGNALTGFDLIDNLNSYELLKPKKTTSKSINAELSLLLPTSGSLGNAKFVRISKRNLKENALSIINYLNLRSSDRAITSMPIGYSFMLSIINSHLECGASLIVTDRSIVDRKFWEIAREHKITSFSGVPFLFETLVRLGLSQLNIPSLRQFTQAGGKLNESVATKIIDFSNRKNVEFFMMYGQTEGSPRMSYLDWKFAEEKLGSIGKPIPGTKMWLEKDREIVTDPGEIGEIVFSGPNACLGYAESLSDLDKPDENNGIIYTGDLASQDTEGFFYIHGRSKRIAKIDGYRIQLDDLETKLKSFEFEVACVGYDGKICIFYENRIDEKSLIKTVSLISNQRKTIFDIRQINALPRTSSGKIQYKTLEKMI